MHFKNAHRLAVAVILFVLAACVGAPSLETRLKQAYDLAALHEWKTIELDSRPYPLHAFIPERNFQTETLNIYIEGDGLAWVSRHKPSSNPTPANPIALQLALLDPQPAVYLARPCQYLTHTHCNQELWTSARFAETVIDSSNHAIDLLKQQFGASSLRLIGYSGGGAIAALVAARRSDVIQLVTVAGNLDHEAWTRHHSISPLHRSLNPADAWHALARIPQVHFIGENDRNIGPFVIDAYLERFPDGQRPPVHLVKDADHYCCWMEHWPALLRIIHAGPGHD